MQQDINKTENKEIKDITVTNDNKRLNFNINISEIIKKYGKIKVTLFLIICAFILLFFYNILFSKKSSNTDEEIKIKDAELMNRQAMMFAPTSVANNNQNNATQIQQIQQPTLNLPSIQEPVNPTNTIQKQQNIEQNVKNNLAPDTPPVFQINPQNMKHNQPNYQNQENNLQINENKKITPEMQKEILAVNSIIFNSSGSSTPPTEKTPVSDNNNTEFLGFDNGMINNNQYQLSSSKSSKATIVKDLDKTIIQGKIIYATLETAIDTQIKAGVVVRAIISKDAFSESHRNIMIPAGSRVIGSYSSQYSPGQTRVSITWDRIIMPNGVDINISSQGSDNLGRAGVEGSVDSEWKMQIASFLITDFIIPWAAYKLTNVADSQIVSNAGGSQNGITTTTSALSQAMSNSANQFQTSVNNIINQRFTQTPHIIINQGTEIKILVSQDLKF